MPQLVIKLFIDCIQSEFLRQEKGSKEVCSLQAEGQ